MEPGVVLTLVTALLVALAARQAQQSGEPAAVPVRVDDTDAESARRG